MGLPRSDPDHKGKSWDLWLGSGITLGPIVAVNPLPDGRYGIRSRGLLWFFSLLWGNIYFGNLGDLGSLQKTNKTSLPPNDPPAGITLGRASHSSAHFLLVRDADACPPDGWDCPGCGFRLGGEVFQRLNQLYAEGLREIRNIQHIVLYFQINTKYGIPPATRPPSHASMEWCKIPPDTAGPLRNGTGPLCAARQRTYLDSLGSCLL